MSLAVAWLNDNNASSLNLSIITIMTDMQTVNTPAVPSESSKAHIRLGLRPVMLIPITMNKKTILKCYLRRNVTSAVPMMLSTCSDFHTCYR
jgi:hypothetical protein